MKDTKYSNNLQSLHDLLKPIVDRLDAALENRREYQFPEQSIFVHLNWVIKPNYQRIMDGETGIGFYIESIVDSHDLQIEGELVDCEYSFDGDLYRLQSYDTEYTAYIDGEPVDLDDETYDRVRDMIDDAVYF